MHFLKISFWIRRSRAIQSDQVPIILRVHLGPERRDRHTGYFATPAEWDSVKGRLTGRSKTNATINEALDQLRVKLTLRFNQLSQFSAHVKLDQVLADSTQVNQEESSKTLIQLVKLHNEDFQSRLTVDRSESTYEKYLFTEDKLKRFLLARYKLNDIPLAKVNLQFVKEFQKYLMARDGNAHNTTTKYLKNLKRILNYGIEMEWIATNPIQAFKSGYKFTEQVILSREELDRIRNKQFTIERLQLVKDLFIFQCFSGLSYVDIKNLTHDRIKAGPDGDSWIYLERTKTGTRVAIPLLEPVKELIEKYRVNNRKHGDPNLVFPAYCIHKANAYLKEVADLCGIEKNLTTHVGRRTFATTVLLGNGTPIEVISRVLGHLNIQTTQIYARVSDQLIKKEMNRINDTLTSSPDRV